MGLGPENTTFTFCVTNSIASDAISAVQALPACTLAHLIILRGDQGVMCKQTGLGQHNLGGPVIRSLSPKRIISISARGVLHSQGDLLVD